MQRRKLKMSDLELISLSLPAEYLGIDSENDLSSKLPISISTLIECSVYDRRKCGLLNHMNDIRQKLALSFNQYEDCFIVDSMPLEVCKLYRSLRSNICKDNPYSYPDRGIVHLKK